MDDFPHARGSTNRIGAASDVVRRGAALIDDTQRLRLITDAASDGIWEWDLLTDQVLWSDRVYELFMLPKGAFGRTFAAVNELVHPDDLAPFREALRAHIEENKPYKIEMRYRRGDGTYGCFLCQGQAVRDPAGKATYMVGSIRDITKRKLAELGLLRRNRELSVLYRIGRAASSSLEIAALLKESLDVVIETFGVDGAGFYLLDTGSETMTLQAQRGLSEPFVEKIRRIKLGEGVSGRAAAEGRPIVLDIRDYPSEHLAPFVRREGIQTLVSTPLIAAGRVVGSLNLAARRSVVFPPEELDLLASIGQQVGLAVQNARLFQGVHRDLHHCGQVEDELRETADYLEKLINYANAPIIVWDVVFKITRFNRAFEQLSGRSARDVIGRELSLLFPAASRAESLDKIRRTSAGEHWESVEIPILRQDGAMRIALWNSANIHTVDGRVIATIAQGQDITERKKVEEALQESETKYRTLIESSSDLIWSLDREGNFTFLNRRAEEVGGFAAAELLGRSFAPLIPAADLPRIASIFAATMSGTAQRYTVDFHRKDGSLVSLDVNTSPILQSGEIVGSVSFGQDITESKRAEAFIANILESVDEGLAVINREHRIVSANRAYTELVGQSVEDIIGQHCYRVSHHLSRPCFEKGEECAVRHTFLTGQSHRAMHTHFDSAGNAAYIEIKSFPMKDRGGKIGAVIEILSDVTERKKLEEQLRHAQKMEAIGTLAGGIAHDFNNIVAVITGYAEIIKLALDSGDPSRSKIEEILKAADRAAHLTKSLLSFSRRQPVKVKPVDLDDAIALFRKMLVRIIGEDVELRIERSAADLTVLADQVQLDQILMNLATNARDAMPGGGLLTIRTESVEMDQAAAAAHGAVAPGRYALVSVSDTGQGIDEMTQQRIFDPFFTTKDPGKGTGLGLSIVYGIVKQYRGWVDVLSEKGKGTTFNIYLPLANVTVVQAPPAPLPETSVGSGTILLVEDESQLRLMVRTFLEGNGYNVLEAVDGEDALRVIAADQERIRLVLLDMIMPKKNGRETYEEMIRIRPGIKAIFMSGHVGDILDRQLIADEAFLFLEKPFALNDLLAKIQQAMNAGTESG